MANKIENKSKKGEGKMEVRELPIKAAIVQPDLNARKDGKGGVDYTSVPGLMKDVDRDGLLQPVIGCINDDGTWTIYAGFCRLEACRRLGWTNIPVHVVEQKGPRDRALINGRENLSRDNLSTYDKARYLCDLTETHKMSIKDVLVALPGDISLNQKNVQLYVNAVKQLHPKVLEAWMVGHKMASTMRLFALLKHPQDDQPRIWQAMIDAESIILRDAGVVESDIAAIKENPFDSEAFDRALSGKVSRGKKGASTQVADVVGEKAEKVVRPDKDTIALVSGWMKEGMDGISPEVAQVVLSVVGWMTGQNKCLVIAGQTVYDPEADKAAKAKAGETEKAKAKANKLESELAALRAKMAEQGFVLQ